MSSDAGALHLDDDIIVEKNTDEYKAEMKKGNNNILVMSVY